MNPVQAFVVGFAPMHVPALIAGLLAPFIVLVVRRMRYPSVPGESTVDIKRPAPTVLRQWAAWLLGVSGAVHLALPIGHFDGPLLTVGFLGSGAAFVWLGLRAWEGRSWRLWSALLLVATLLAYLIVSGTGGEEPDQVGVATALIELVALGLCLVPAREAQRPKRFKRFAGSFGTVAVTLLVGTAVWIGSFAAHAATDHDVSVEDAVDGTTVGHAADHEHAHDHAARAQAGVVMRPQSSAHPTVEQVAGAQRLADATKAAMVKYARLADALAAGYALPPGGQGPDVHLENKANRADGRVLDPERPETLVYAISGQRATLLGVVYVMERAGVPAPEPGGPITRWHAHNICLTFLPVGFGIVSPFGSCPALSLSMTTPEMMHVWVVDDPDGPFAEGLDKAWVLAYHAEHGIPIDAR